MSEVPAKAFDYIIFSTSTTYALPIPPVNAFMNIIAIPTRRKVHNENIYITAR
jgi:hypothetical protein